jgi:Flp pilus assembly pilin Flp
MKNRLDLLINRIRILAGDTKAQDMIEYALLAGFIAVAAGALLPTISTSISTIFSKMGSVLTIASKK